MERDFIGLTVKKETLDEAIHPAPVKSSPMQWSFSNNGVSAVPQLLSFQGAQEEKPKTGFDSLASTGLLALTTTEAFDSDHKPYAVPQKNNMLEQQGTIRYSLTTYPARNLDANGIPRAIVNQTAASGQNLVGSVSLSSQTLCGVPLINPVPAIPGSQTTDMRNTSKISVGPAQLTIFYNGSVSVYDNISPEKAQAIMLLAGNAPPSTPSAKPPIAPAQTPMPRPSVLESFVVNQPYGTKPHHSSPIPVPAVNVPQSPGYTAAVNQVGSVSANFITTDSVPQFRRKSLARFLKKRKERVISASPFAEKRSKDCSNPSLSVNS